MDISSDRSSIRRGRALDRRLASCVVRVWLAGTRCRWWTATGRWWFVESPGRDVHRPSEGSTSAVSARYDYVDAPRWCVELPDQTTRLHDRRLNNDVVAEINSGNWGKFFQNSNAIVNLLPSVYNWHDLFITLKQQNAIKKYKKIMTHGVLLLQSDHAIHQSLEILATVAQL